MPCTSEKTAMDGDWNSMVNSVGKTGLYGVGGGVLVVGGLGALYTSAGAEVVSLGSLTIPAGAVATGGFAALGGGIGSLGVAGSSAIDAYTNFRNYQSKKEAYEACIQGAIRFKPISEIEE